MSGRESGKIVEKSGPNSIRWLPKMCRFAGKVLAQFKLSTFNSRAPTVQNYPFVGFWKVLYLCTNSVVVGKIEPNLKPRVVAVAEPSTARWSLDKMSNFCTIDSSHQFWFTSKAWKYQWISLSQCFFSFERQNKCLSSDHRFWRAKRLWSLIVRSPSVCLIL